MCFHLWKKTQFVVPPPLCLTTINVCPATGGCWVLTRDSFSNPGGAALSPGPDSQTHPPHFFLGNPTVQGTIGTKGHILRCQVPRASPPPQPVPWLPLRRTATAARRSCTQRRAATSPRHGRCCGPGPEIRLTVADPTPRMNPGGGGNETGAWSPWDGLPFQGRSPH